MRIPAGFVVWLVLWYGAWAAVVFGNGLWDLTVSQWPMAAAMAFGSYFAGSTPMGGGTIGFPVLVLLFDQPATLGRDFSLAVQAIGMTSAAVLILTRRQVVAWRVLLSGAAVGSVSTVVSLLFVAQHVPSAIVEITFASLWASFGVMMFLKLKSISETTGFQPPSARTEVVTGAVVGLIGGVLVSITGVGIDMLAFVALTIFCRSSLQISIPTSVILMAAMSIIGSLTKTVTGTWNPDVLGAWLAAAPVVTLGAPFGAIVVALIDRRVTLIIVSVLCLGQYAWTCFAKQPSTSTLVMSVVGVVIFNYVAHRLYELYFPQAERRSNQTVGPPRRWGR